MNAIVCRVALVLGLAVATGAEGWPERPIRFIVPYPTGGGVDVLARLVGQRLSEYLGQPVVIDNRPGAATQIGTEIAAKAARDGYTLLLGSPSFTNNVSLFSRLSYDPERDFEPVTLMASVPMVLIVSPSLPANSVRELIELAKAKPGSMSYGMANGSTPHLAGEMLKAMGGVAAVPIPYKGMAPAYPDLISGRIHFIFDALSTGLPHAQAGRVKALGVSSAKRSQAAPDLPTLAESGLPGFQADGWYGTVVPKGTPARVVSRLNAEMIRVLNDPATAARINAAGFQILAIGPQEFGAFMRAESARWSKLIKQAGIRAE